MVIRKSVVIHKIVLVLLEIMFKENFLKIVILSFRTLERESEVYRNPETLRDDITTV